ncbi:XkdX family protein [Lysinibacillus sp. NPDC058147]
MTIFESLKERYEKNWCRKDQLRRYVQLSAISPEQYKELTNEEYNIDDEG